MVSSIRPFSADACFENTVLPKLLKIARFIDAYLATDARMFTLSEAGFGDILTKALFS